MLMYRVTAVLALIATGLVATPAVPGAASVVRVGVGDFSVVEGDDASRQVRIPVSLSSPQPANVWVRYTVAPLTASAGADYLAKSTGTVTIKAGKVHSALTVRILGDTDPTEGDETFAISLTGASSAVVIARVTGVVTILDDDPTAALEVAVGDLGVVEGDAGGPIRVNVPVTLSSAASSDVTLTFAVVPENATSGVDYQANPIGTLVIKAGQPTATVRVDVIPDGTREGDETLRVVLSASTMGTLRRAAGRLTILDDDPEHLTGQVLYTWGSNENGQLGDGTNADRNAPAAVGTGSVWVAAAAGGAHSCGIRTDGSLWCWGRNANGQLGDGTTANRTVPVPVSVGADWRAVAAGWRHTCGIRSDGTLWCWGLNTYGQLGDGTTANRSVPTKVGAATTWDTVAAGGNHTCATRTDGTLWCWGSNGLGQLGDGATSNRTSPTQVTPATDWIALAVGWSHSCGIRSNQTLWCWGGNSSGQVGDGTTTSRSTPTSIGSFGNWTHITAGGEHTCAISTTAGSPWWVTTRSLYCWGGNHSGQLGDGTTSGRTTPTWVPGDPDWKQVVAGAVHTCGIRESYSAPSYWPPSWSMWCWGGNGSGQVGDTTNINRTAPRGVGISTGSATRLAEMGGVSSHTLVLG